MAITVINLCHNRNVEGHRCDRASVLGNPFHMFQEAERTAVVAAFREYLHEVANLRANPVDVVPGLANKYNVTVSGMWKRPSRAQIMAELAKLEAMSEVKLLCWCAPLSCHCDVIKSYLEWKRPEPLQLGLS
ncbi:DUF4326 domain-containing protein (plasmid) [Acaryochloris sp. 'Moss Beach']|uniref:DUF4326 domain-containing protein n=1 Tax=Acaryochloris sp. 'Moss Beach' TaxID=2740837 RepID=UPI001F463DCC|nr:DUF4326 domain-containing protein [Acaryochloris sp. 'Moss Beach']UJB72745.1 DUF4326 domain-containing protein [Acaryochloris sp. 'Moss Beach']